MFEVYFFVTIFSAATKIQMDVMPSLWEVIHREEKSMDWTHTNDNINKDFFCRKLLGNVTTKISLQKQWYIF